MSDARAVFICWSGTRSRAVADALVKAIRALDCGLEPRVSPEIAKGSVWFEQVRRELDRADAAIVCLTPENVGNPWMHFEAGAIAAKVDAKVNGAPRVYPYLFEMNGAELAGPLSQFQATSATEEDTLRLVRQLMPAKQWEQWSPTAGTWWSALEAGLRSARDRPLGELLSDIEALFRRKTFDEPLDECVNQAWAARWSGARETHRQLQERARFLKAQCRPYVDDLVAELVEAVDSYAMALELLLAPLSFQLTPAGKRAIPPGLLAACEDRRRSVKELMSRLVDPRQAPVFEDAVRFQAAESFAEKKALVHRFEAWLEDRERAAGTSIALPSISCRSAMGRRSSRPSNGSAWSWRRRARRPRAATCR